MSMNSVPKPLDRHASVERIQTRSAPWDLVVIGGGATGVGIALDAATRGLDVVLVERDDFGKGTSSRSTKLVHGGVRYLQQGNLTLVRDALRERSLLRKNAPHTVHPLSFIIPCDSKLARWYYWTGLKLYDVLATGRGFAGSKMLDAKSVGEHLPTLANHGTGGGVQYQDGQFDDTQLLTDMALTAAQHNACLLNYANAFDFEKSTSGSIVGVHVTDKESNQSLEIRGRAVVNATGPFCDQLRAVDAPDSSPLVAASQGVHIVLPKDFLPGSSALMVPKTSDGRVLFMIPWYDHVLVGTTDTAIDEAIVEPSAQDQEIDFILETASDYLNRRPGYQDILSVFTGIRPLVQDDPSARTASLSRDHKIQVSNSGLITITGGKWTTVRKMAEDVVDRAIKTADLPSQPCRTTDTAIIDGNAIEPDGADPTPLHQNFAYTVADVQRAVRYQMARTVEDVLARRTRCLFLNTSATMKIAETVADVMAIELQKDGDWKQKQLSEFRETASHFFRPSQTMQPR
ncbi:FAD-dependent oxidoreductase [Crateriforma spongiae]|uniref:glycerol-3-phosphate dehydrogenase/oxidase n=1 Tax=Crateriforma spongiae TaxID=2724528 RepID=UPI0039B0775A